MSNLKVLVVGESCQDIFVYGVSNRLAPEAPAPVFLEVSRTESPGMAMNVKRNVNSFGVDCDIWTNKNWKSITKTRYIDDRTNHMFLRVDCNDKAFSQIAITDEMLEKVAEYNVVVLSDYNKGFLLESDIIKISSKNNVVLLDSKKILGDWCEHVKYVKINGDEYSKTKSVINERLSKKLIVTLGKDGCIFQDQKFSVDSVSVKDVAGAGDTFIAALAVQILAGKDLPECLKFANDCATKVVQKRGVSTPNDSLD